MGLNVRASLLRQDFIEGLQFRSRLATSAIVVGMRRRYLTLLSAGKLLPALEILSKLWRRFPSDEISRFCEGEYLHLEQLYGRPRLAKAWYSICKKDHDPKKLRSFRDAILRGQSSFDGRMLILAPATAQERGTIVLKFSIYFSYFQALFRPEIFDSYHLVLEPSWVGYFEATILQFIDCRDRVFLEGNEQRDIDFISRLDSALVPIGMAANHWVHPEVFKPLPGIEKRYTIAMVAIWADFKRHRVLFRALAAANDPSIRVVLIGMPHPRTLESIRAEAEHYGVADQIELFEVLTQEQINVKLNESRAHIILSLKEGCNKAVVESMFAGTPSFLLEGFNYGTKYPYINSETGGFVSEDELPQLLKRIHRGEFDALTPRRWIETHISPESSTERLERAIYGDARGRLAVKVNSPEMQYRDSGAAEFLAADYSRLKEFLRENPSK